MRPMLDTLGPIPLPAACPDPMGGKAGPSSILQSVLDLFDRDGLRHCVLHGRDDAGPVQGSDVDCVVDRAVSPRGIHRLLHEHRDQIGARLVRCRGYLVQLAGLDADGSPCFLTLDLSVDAGAGDLTFYTGAEVLDTRRRVRGMWAPSTAIEFGNYLAKCVAKGRLDPGRAKRLSQLFRADRRGCAGEVARFWGGGSADLIVSAAESGDWSAVRSQAGSLREELVRASRRRFPGRHLASRLARVADRAARLLRPDGLSVVVLGPDGAGKSSTTDALGASRLIPAFDRSVCWGFVPPLHRLIGRNLGPSSEPHALPPRSLANSILRATYWFLYSTAGHARVHLALARTTLVLYDRHFVDVLVDPKRYRYRGPMWPMRLIWRLMPKPDLVILLDAPAEIVQSRKQEVPLAETARQRRAYLSLVSGLRNGRIVDASQPFERVLATVTGIVTQHLAARTAQRLGFEGAPQSASPAKTSAHPA